MYAIRVNKNTTNQVQFKAHPACSDSDLIGFFIGTIMEKICLYCGKIFGQKPKVRPQIYCRPACRSLAWKKRNKLQNNAHNAVYKARKKGKLCDKMFCEICGKAKPEHRHHEDYKKPLKLIWVCTKCHDSLKRK